MSTSYFEVEDRFADFVVHETAHVFHNNTSPATGLVQGTWSRSNARREPSRSERWAPRPNACATLLAQLRVHARTPRCSVPRCAPRVKAHLAARPFPHFEPAGGRSGFVVKIDEDGTRTVGRFVNREFRPAGRR